MKNSATTEQCAVSRVTKKIFGEELMKIYKTFLSEGDKPSKACINGLILEIREALQEKDKEVIVEAVFELLNQVCLKQAEKEGEYVTGNSLVKYFNIDDKTVTELVKDLATHIEDQDYLEAMGVLEDILYQLDFETLNFLKSKRGC